MSDEAAFLDALKANPADDTTRLVYADWLDEHGVRERAEYLRLVVLLARASGDLASRHEGTRVLDLAAAFPGDSPRGAPSRLEPSAEYDLSLVLRTARPIDVWSSRVAARFAVLAFTTNPPAGSLAPRRQLADWILGPGPAKSVSEMAPHRLLDRVTFEAARAGWSRGRAAEGTVAVAVLPMEAQTLPYTLSYEVVVGCLIRGGIAEPQAQTAQKWIRWFLSRARGTVAAADALGKWDVQLVLARGVSADEANEQVRALSRYLPARQQPDPGALRVFARLIATPND